MRAKSTQRIARIKITPEMRKAYEERDRRLDNDPDAPTLPPEYWQNATVGKFYRPLKTPVSLRIDNDVLAWLKSQGEGHLTRINEILRERMDADYWNERKREARKKGHSDVLKRLAGNEPPREGDELPQATNVTKSAKQRILRAGGH